MKLAIMQPYVFPYVGYFQLIHSVDKFVIYDDVNFIKQGWINRNRILSNNAALLFSVPLEQISSYKRIDETRINQKLYAKWQTKFLTTIEQSYKKAPCFPAVYPLIEGIFSEAYDYINQLCLRGIMDVMKYLQFKTEIVPTSCGYNNSHLKAQYRVIDICRLEGASVYINPPGGIDLYHKTDFHAANLELFFLKSKAIVYPQFKRDFISGLSIIDVMMFNPHETISRMMDDYVLI